MLFQTLSALWWWLPLTGIIILLYLLRMRRRDVQVPATFLWPKMTSDVRANAPFQRLRFSILLLVQLLILTLLVFGLANPLRKTKGLHGKATVVVLDSSASMGSTDISPTRFEAARRKIAGLVATLSSGDQLAAVEAGATTRILFPLSNDTAVMQAALRNLRPSDSPNDMSEALRLASALVGNREGGRIVVFSDGAFPPVKDFSPGKASLLYDNIGTSSRNVAITALEAAQTPQGTQLFAGIRNYENQSRKVTLTFEVDGRTTDAKTLTIPPRQTLGETLKISPTAKRADVRIAAEGDILESDNHAALFLQGAETVRVLLVTAGNLFLERALVLDPSVRLDKAPTVPEYERIGATGDGRYDLIIFDAVPPQPVKSPAVWSLGGFSADLPVQDAGGTQARPRVRTWKRTHPLLRHANDLDGLLIEKSRKVRAKPEAETLLEGDAGALIVSQERAGRRTLYFAWNLLDSDMPLRVSFPILVSNAVTWLTKSEQGNSRGITARTGQTLALPITESGVKTLQLQTPQKGNLNIDGATGVALLRAIENVGDYTLKGNRSRTEIVVNLLNEAESDTTPNISLNLSGSTVKAQGEAVVLADMWRPLVVLALVLLALEWLLFVRRS
jgi:hypothetical protein